MFKPRCSLLVAVVFIALARGYQQTERLPCPSELSRGEFSTTLKIPEGCLLGQCDFFLGMKQDENDLNLLNFVLEGKANGWVSIGFSQTPDMYTADVLGCRRLTTGEVEVIDTWNTKNAKVNVLKEDQDDLCLYKAEYNDGRLQCTFSRIIEGTSNEYDLHLNNYYYFIYGTGNTPSGGGLSYHEETPLITSYRINPMNGRVFSTLPVSSASNTIHKSKKKGENTQTQSTYCSTSSVNSTSYRLTQRIPQGCVDSKCDFFVGISDNKKNSHMLDFTLQGKAKGWVAVGFSETPDMLSADVLGCTVYGDGSFAAIDTWNPSSTKTNNIDLNQSDICQRVVEMKDGMIKCKFSRSIKGASNGQDLALNRNYYLIFATGETPQESLGGGFTFHEQTPIISNILINPVEDSDFSVTLASELAMIENAENCPDLLENTDSPEYRISYRLPEGCGEATIKCEVFLGINTNSKDSNYLDFTLSGKAKGWVAVGFSTTPDMLSSDVLGCNVYGDGRLAAVDTWNPSSMKTNVLDNTKAGFCHHSAQFEGELLTCKFTRRVKGTSDGQDLDLNKKYYVTIGTGDTQQESGTGGFTFHQKTPTIIEKQINPLKDKQSNLYEDSAVASFQESPAATRTSSGFRLIVNSPTGCNAFNNECNYFLGIKTNSEDSNVLDFTLSGKTSGWVSVGFSKTPNMLASDVLGCNVYSDGSVSAIDTWCPTSTRTNILDEDQTDIKQHVAQISDGHILCSFSRSIKGASDNQDLDLNSKYFLFFGRGETAQSFKSGGGFTYHQTTPTISLTQMNPFYDSDVSLELVSIQESETCPSFSSDTSNFRVSTGIPESCEQSKTCDYFIGINTNSKNSEFLDFTLEAKANGWVAVGFSKTRSMPESDVVGCSRYVNGTLLAIDTWNPKTPLINTLDEPQIDICSSFLNYSDGKISCRFSKAIIGATPGRDLDLNSDLYLMFGTGETLRDSYGGFNYHQIIPTLTKDTVNVVDSGAIVLAASKISSFSVKALKKTHGIFMIIAWPILAGLAIYFPAYLKPILCKKGEWFQLHRALMLGSITFGTISFILIFIANIDSSVPGLAYIQSPIILAHFILGIIVTALPFTNALLSLIRCKPSGKYRWIYNLVHGKMIGYFAITLALANIALGIYIFESGPSQAFSIFLIASVIGILIYLTLHFIYNVLPRLWEGETGEKESLKSEEEKATVDIQNIKNEKYRSNIGILILVQLSLVVMNIAVCICIAIA